MSRVRSYSGKMIDFDEMKASNQEMPTAGNTNTNVAGDIIDENGKVVMKASEVVKVEYSRSEKAVVSSTLFDDIDDDDYTIIDNPQPLKNKASKEEPKVTNATKTIRKDDKLVLGDDEPVDLNKKPE